MVSPQAKREAVTVLMTEHDFGVTRACGLVRISSSLYRYRSRRPDRPGLRERIEEIAALKRRYGYRRMSSAAAPRGLDGESQATSIGCIAKRAWRCGGASVKRIGPCRAQAVAEAGGGQSAAGRWILSRTAWRMVGGYDV